MDENVNVLAECERLLDCALKAQALGGCDLFLNGVREHLNGSALVRPVPLPELGECLDAYGRRIGMPTTLLPERWWTGTRWTVGDEE